MKIQLLVLRMTFHSVCYNMLSLWIWYQRLQELQAVAGSYTKINHCYYSYWSQNSCRWVKPSGNVFWLCTCE